MKPGKPSAEVTQDLEHKAWMLRTTEQMTYRAIAQKLGVTLDTAFNAVKRRREELAGLFIEKAREVAQDHTDRLDALAAQAMVSFRRSERATTMKRTVSRLAATDEDKANADKDGFVRELVEEVRPGQANPAFLNVVRGSLKDIRDIWGVDAAMAIAVKTIGDEDDIPAEHAFFAGMAVDALRAAVMRVEAEGRGGDDN